MIKFQIKLLIMIFLFSMKISGAFASTECEVMISQPVVNYGKLNQSDVLNVHRQFLSLDKRDVQVTALCSEPHNLALTFSGNGDKDGFRFGTHGLLKVVAENATLDGRHVALSKNNIVNHFHSRGAGTEKRLILNYTQLQPVDEGQILSGQQFSVTLQLSPLLRAGEEALTDTQLLVSQLKVQVVTTD